MPVYSFIDAAGLGSAKPLPSHNFLVIVGAMPIPFSRVSSIEIGIETEVLQEGGENRFVHSLSKPASTEKTLVLERGVDSELIGAVLSTLARTALRVGSRFGNIIIAVLDQNGLPKKVYVASDAIIKKRRMSDLNAMSGEVFVESLEFAYKELTEVLGINVMFGGIAKAIASFSGFSSPKEQFTKPLSPPLPQKPKPPRFTLPKITE